MALSSCFVYQSQFPLQIQRHGSVLKHHHKLAIESRLTLSVHRSRAKFSGDKLTSEWSFLGGCRVKVRPKAAWIVPSKTSSEIHSSWMTSPQIASSVFTIGTAAVLPFYTLMVVCPRSEFTKKTMKSSMPYVALGLLYAYLLCLSWTPETIRLMFASKYWLPELQSIAKMFSNEMTLASAWIHLLAVDLFAARQVYHDGLENEIETRHSVSLCLLFCPVGILTHVITKALTGSTASTKNIL